MRAGMTLAVVLLLAACAGAQTPSTAPTRSPAPAGTIAGATLAPSAPASAPGSPADPVRILGTGLWDTVGGSFSVAAATNQADYDALWLRLDKQPPVPAVDFERETVVFLGISGSSSCPERFERLVVDLERLHVFAQWLPPDPGQPCTDDLQPQGVLLAVESSQLPEQPFVLSLREQPICPDCADHPDQQLVAPAR